MKTTPFVLIAVLAGGCARPSTGKVQIRPLAVPPAVHSDGLRYAEIVRPYYVGRTVDSDHGNQLHEAHPVYRLESPAHWNLHPAGSAGRLDHGLLVDPAHAPVVTTDAATAELNHQREISARMLAESARLESTLNDVRKLLTDTAAMVRSNSTWGIRLAAVENQLRVLAAQSPPAEPIGSPNPVPATPAP